MSKDVLDWIEFLEKKYDVKEKKKELSEVFELEFGFPPQKVTPKKAKSVFSAKEIIGEERLKDLLLVSGKMFIKEAEYNIIFSVRYATVSDLDKIELSGWYKLKNRCGIFKVKDGFYFEVEIV